MISQEVYGKMPGGQEVIRYTLENANGMKIGILSYGCIIDSIIVPDKNGTPTDVVLGYDSLEDYLAGSCNFGAFVGRYANRIKNAQFELNGIEYTLEKNNGEHHLHGIYKEINYQGSVEHGKLIFRRTGPDGEEGFPGNLSYDVIYYLTDEDALFIEYRASSDKDTVLNFTNHSYFNLNGQDESTVDGILLQINADSFTENDEGAAPTGRILSVEGTDMDFRTPREIGKGFASEYAQIKLFGGYDSNYVLGGSSMKLAATALSPKTGIALDCYTTQPGVQLFTTNFKSAERGKGGILYPPHGAFCLETQHFPCSPNYPEFPSAVLKAGDQYHETTVYRFYVK